MDMFERTVKNSANYSLFSWRVDRVYKNFIDIGTQIYYLREYMHRLKINIVLVAYRGYSDSEGVPTEKGLMLDGEAIVDHLL